MLSRALAPSIHITSRLFKGSQSTLNSNLSTSHDPDQVGLHIKNEIMQDLFGSGVHGVHGGSTKFAVPSSTSTSDGKFSASPLETDVKEIQKHLLAQLNGASLPSKSDENDDDRGRSDEELNDGVLSDDSVCWAGARLLCHALCFLRSCRLTGSILSRFVHSIGRTRIQENSSPPDHCFTIQTSAFANRRCQLHRVARLLLHPPPQLLLRQPSHRLYQSQNRSFARLRAT